MTGRGTGGTKLWAVSMIGETIGSEIWAPALAGLPTTLVMASCDPRYHGKGKCRFESVSDGSLRVQAPSTFPRLCAVPVGIAP